MNKIEIINANHDNGSKWYEIPCLNGVRHGLCIRLNKYWYYDGSISLHSTHKQSRYHGIKIRFDY